MNDLSKPAADVAEAPVLIPALAYVLEAHARAEGEKLWPKVWQIACRVEEIPNVGDYVTYAILDESIVVVRTAADRIQKSRGFPGLRPNPSQELPVAHFNRTLAAYMGAGAPQPITSTK